VALVIIRRTPLWIFLLLLAFITFYAYDNVIFAYMRWYMNSAFNVFIGKGPANMDGSVVSPPFFIMGIGQRTQEWKKFKGFISIYHFYRYNNISLD